jgi:hypothetical protein
VTSAWLKHEQDIYKATVALARTYDIPAVFPVLPHIFGFSKMYRSKSLLKLKLAVSREWFQVWLGALSYFLARARCENAERKDPYPRWRQVLERAGVSPAWMDEVWQSVLCCFDVRNPRAGCIVDLIHPVEGQPEVEWLVAHGIPVWYRWGEEEERLAEKDAGFAKRRPPKMAAHGECGTHLGKSSSRSTHAKT